MILRKRIYVRGVVQGVGFRPFVYNLAKRLNITGYVLNNSYGVIIEAQAKKPDLTKFINNLQNNPPVLAQIYEFETFDIPVADEPAFTIRKSNEHQEKFTLVSPDISICNDCLNELFDPENRRYRYPFINCTNCGPRYTIIQDIPYDRANTTMSIFRMCDTCQKEYENPQDRRFHAQPNACPECGPKIQLLNREGKTVSGDSITNTIEFLKQGKIIAIKGLGGFHLAVDALNENAVQELRERKNRYEKPFAVMSESIASIEHFAHMNDQEKEILLSPQRPICLLKNKYPNALASSVSPDNEYFGVMLPYTPLHYLLMREGDFQALVMTSGNKSEEPIVYENEVAFEQLGRIADYFLLNNRDIYQRADDSVVRLMNSRSSHVRRSRGFVPLPVFVKRELPSVLAVGGELKNTLCLNKNNHFFLSQHIGDLENMETLEFFEEAVSHLQKIIDISPKLMAYDPHPEYLSTKWALQQNELPVTYIQHHHAHIGACMSEYSLTNKVIGFSMDGTGYGLDGTIWGGEVLVADEIEFKRVGHLRTVPMPGGEKAIKEPWRMATGYCRKCDINLDINRRFADVTDKEAGLVKTMLEKQIHSPLTSSCGRLFDAVAALVGLRHRVGYEGQAAMQLEALLSEADTSLKQAYSFDLVEDQDETVIDWQPMFTELMEDLNNGVSKGKMSFKFHRGLVEILVVFAEKLRKLYDLNRVVISGGCFQNRFLTEVLVHRLEEANFEVFYHTIVPPNDGGLSLGQAYIAAHRLKEGKMS